MPYLKQRKSSFYGILVPAFNFRQKRFSRTFEPRSHGQQDQLGVDPDGAQGQAFDEAPEDDHSGHLEVGKFLRGRAEQGQVGLHEVERSEVASRVLLVREGFDRHRNWPHHGKSYFFDIGWDLNPESIHFCLRPPAKDQGIT